VQFASAWATRKLHHAWLLAGPRGVGKASFAHAAARRVRADAAGPPVDLPGLETPEDHPMVRLVEAGSHPDMRRLERLTNEKTGNLNRNIKVDQVRELGEFMGMTAALSPWRVAVIDSVDDLETSGANALLKMLEEPPPNTIFFLVSHAPGRLLPTIRSRCRRLVVPAPELSRAAAMVEERVGVSSHDADRLARMAKGAPGRALQLAAAGALAADDAAGEILRKLPDLDEGALLAMADTFKGAEGAARFELLFDRLGDQIHAMATGMAGERVPAGLDRWVAAWEKIMRAPGEAEAVNLDRADVFWTAIMDLRAAARAAM
jgi:DNA polymerase-3 subunit delta'